MMLRRALLVFACAAFAAVAAPALAAEQRFELSAGAAMSLTIPAGWTHEQQTTDARAITFKPKTGKAFHVVLTPLVRPDGALLRTDTETLKAVVEDAAQKVLPQSQETSLPLQLLVGGSGRGFYFSATDRNPKPTEFQYLTQGVMSVQGLPVSFLILSNGDGKAPVQAAFEMLKTAKRH